MGREMITPRAKAGGEADNRRQPGSNSQKSPRIYVLVAAERRKNPRLKPKTRRLWEYS